MNLSQVIANKKDMEEVIEDEIREMKEKFNKLKSDSSADAIDELPKIYAKIQKLLKIQDERASERQIEVEEQKNMELINQRNQYVDEMLGTNVQLTEFDQNIIPGSSRRVPQQQQQPTSSDSKRQAMSYYNLTGVDPPKPLIQSKIEHEVYKQLDKVAKKMHAKGDAVPDPVADRIKKQKKIISDKVKEYLKPYYDANQIDREHYTIVVETLTRHHWELNEYGKSVQHKYF